MSKVLNDSALNVHFDHYSQDKQAYFDEVYEVFSNRNLYKTLSLQTKSRVLAVLLHRLDRDSFVKLIDHIDLPELTRACEILDAPRFIKQYKAKLDKVGDKKKRMYEAKISDARILCEDNYDLSLSLSKTKLVRLWTKSIPADKLEFRAIMYKTDLWKRLADLNHLHPEKDFNIKWFLPYCFGKPVPEGTFTHLCMNLSIDNFYQAYGEHHIPYETIRNKLDLTKTYYNTDKHAKIDEIKNTILEREPLDKILWYFNELHTGKSEQIILKRREELDQVVNTNLAYGTLIELIMKVNSKELGKHLMEVADSKMKSYNLNIQAPVAVLGDASSSMEVAIKTSGVIASLLCYMTSADLHLFRKGNQHIENPPRTVQDAIDFARNMRACESTSPVSSLNFYYEPKKEVKTFIMVTDEEENTGVNGQWFSRYGYGSNSCGQDELTFAKMYKKYISEVCPAKLIIVSFSDLNNPAQMERELKQELGDSMGEMVKVFKFHKTSPDLNKLDLVLKYLESISDKKPEDKPVQEEGYFASISNALGWGSK